MSQSCLRQYAFALAVNVRFPSITSNAWTSNPYSRQRSPCTSTVARALIEFLISQLRATRQPPRKTPDNKALIHHSDRGSQYLSIKYTERLIEVGIDPSVGTVGDSYDNALAECVIELFKTEVINQIGPWKSMREVEWETLKWVDWYNNRRLLGPIG